MFVPRPCLQERALPPAQKFAQNADRLRALDQSAQAAADAPWWAAKRETKNARQKAGTNRTQTVSSIQFPVPMPAELIGKSI
jgi:hypothetical protein